MQDFDLTESNQIYLSRINFAS